MRLKLINFPWEENFMNEDHFWTSDRKSYEAKADELSMGRKVHERR